MTHLIFLEILFKKLQVGLQRLFPQSWMDCWKPISEGYLFVVKNDLPETMTTQEGVEIGKVT